MRWRPASALVLVTATSLLPAPPAHAACVGPSITAVVDSEGTLVIDGEWFGTDCYDTGPPPEGQGVLGAPARDITVAVRQEVVEYVVARGDASEDYTFRVEVAQPPVVGDAVVEARYATQEGFTSQLIATVEVTLPETDDAAAGTTVASFGRTEEAASAPEQSDPGTDIGPGVVSLLGGAAVGALGMWWWNRRRLERHLTVRSG